MYEYRDEEWLSNMYVDKRLSAKQISIECGVSPATIQKYLNKYNIESRSISEANKGEYNGAWIDNPIKDMELLYHEYVTNELSFREIAEKYSTSKRTIARYIKKYNIPVDSERLKKSRAKFLEKYNYKDKNTCETCGVEISYNANLCSSCYHDKRNSEYEKSLDEIDNISITNTLRTYTQNYWKPKILERDGFMCRRCERDEDLHTHHIIPFSYIRDRIILENSNFIDLNTKEGKLELLNLCTTDWRINDVDNGITLCKRCHEDLHKSIKIYENESIYKYYVKIIKVLDGDTILGEVDLGFNTYKTETFRLYGINSEELNSNDIHLRGKALHTKEVLKEILEEGRIVKLATHKSGKYGRYLATVILNNIDLNKYLTDTGVVRAYKY